MKDNKKQGLGKNKTLLQTERKKIPCVPHEAASGTPLVLDSVACAYICLCLKYKHVMYVYTHTQVLWCSDLLFQNLQQSVAPLKSTATVIWCYEKLTWMTGFKLDSSTWRLNRKKYVLWITQIGINFELLHTTMNTRKVLIMSLLNKVF